MRASCTSPPCIGGRSKRIDSTWNASRHAKNARLSISTFSMKLRSGTNVRGHMTMEFGSHTKKKLASSRTMSSPTTHTST